MDKIMKNKKSLELVTSLFEFQNMFIKIPFLFWPFTSETVERKETKRENTQYLKNKKHIFITFEMLSFGKYKDTSFKFEYTYSY